MKYLLFTCENNKFLLNGFSHQWNKYFGEDVYVSGIDGCLLPEHFTNLNTGNYPLNKWSDQVIDTLNLVKDELIVFLLDDYWLIRKPDKRAILFGAEILKKTSASAFDLSTNSVFGERKFIKSFGKYDLYANNNKYAYSYQAYIWKRMELLRSLRREENPWESELRGLSRMGSPNQVISFHQFPLWYANVRYKGNWDFEGKTILPKRTLSKEDWNELKKLNYIKEN